MWIKLSMSTASQGVHSDARLCVQIVTVDEAKTFYPLFGLGANVALIFSGRAVKYFSQVTTCALVHPKAEAAEEARCLTLLPLQAQHVCCPSRPDLRLQQQAHEAWAVVNLCMGSRPPLNVWLLRQAPARPVMTQWIMQCISRCSGYRGWLMELVCRSALSFRQAWTAGATP